MERSTSRTTIALLGAMMLLCIGLSYFFFAGQSLRLDESQSLWQSSRSPADILTLVSQDVHVPLYNEILHFWRLYIADGVVGARMLSLLFFLFSIPAMYMLGKEAYGRTVGLFGALLLAISPFMNWYGDEIRMYSLFVLMTILNQYFYILILKGDWKRGGTWVGYALTGLIGAFVHYFFLLNLLVQAVFYFFKSDEFPRGSFSRFVTTAVVIALIFVPWAAYVFYEGQAGNQAPLLPVPTSVDLFNTFSQFLFGFQNDNVNTFFLSLWPVAIIFALLALRRGGKLSPVTTYFLLSVLLPIGIAFFVSFLVPVFVSRYLIFTLPSLYLLLLCLFSAYTPRAVVVARWGLVAVMVLTLGIEIASPTTPAKENYAGATAYLENHATAQDVIILSAPFTIYPVEYYYRGPAPIATLPIWDEYSYGPIPPFTAGELPTQVTQLTANHQNVYLLLSYNQGYQSEIQNYFDSHYAQVAHENFSPGLDLYVYRIGYGSVKSVATSTTAMYFNKTPAL